MIGVEAWLLLIFQDINFYFSWARYKGFPFLLILQFFNMQKGGVGRVKPKLEKLKFHKGILA